MLHLLGGRKVILARRCWRRAADSVAPAERRQRGIRQLGAAGGHQLLMDSHEIPLALLEKLQDLLPVRFGFLRTL